MILVEAISKRMQEIMLEKGIDTYKMYMRARKICSNPILIKDIFRKKANQNDINVNTIYLISKILKVSLREFFHSTYFNDIEV